MCCAISIAQETILIGDILSETTGEPIANANIYYQGTQIGTSSDEQGAFILRSHFNKKRTLIISAVGYHTQRYPISPGTMAGMQVMLREKTAMINEILAIPGANPAIPIIAAVRANRERNDRTLISNLVTKGTFSKELYISNIQQRHLQRRLWGSLKVGMISQADSSYILPLYHSQQQVSLQGTNNIAVGNKKEHAIILSASDYSALLTTQGNINFYHNSVSILGRSFLSPLASSGGNYYQYYLIDSLKNGAEKTYIIDFRSHNPFYATFNGTLYIDSATLGISRLEAIIPEQTNINYLRHLSIEQTFAHDHSLQKEDITASLDFTIKIDTSRIFPNVLIKQTFQQDSVAADSISHSQHSISQTDTIPQATDSAIHAIENLPLIRTAKWFASIITTGYIPTNTYVDIGHIQEILQVNEHETVHIGLPFRTNERLWKNVSLEASVGYGFRDQAWKGMGKININLPTLRRNIVSLEYQDHYVWTEVDDFSRLLRENSIGWKTMDFTSYALEALHSNKRTNNTATRQRQFQIWTENDWTENLETNLYARIGTMGYGNPLVGYQKISNYTYQNIGGIFRVGFRERKVDLFFRRIHTYSQYPILYIGAEIGSWQAPNTSHYHMYGKISFLARQDISFGIAGTFNWALSAGCIFGQVPYTMLHHFEGNQGYAYDPYRFTLMNNFQYAANRFLALHAEWNGQGVLFNLIPGIRYLHLREIINCKVAWGDISSHIGGIYDLSPTNLSELSVPYVEVGIGIGNILRIADLYSVWRLTHRDNYTTPRWALRFRLHLGL